MSEKFSNQSQELPRQPEAKLETNGIEEVAVSDEIDENKLAKEREEIERENKEKLAEVGAKLGLKNQEQNPELQKSLKEVEWEKKQEEVEGWKDKLGRGIEKKIKDAIVAFNMSGLPTSASCEGHLDSGHGAPWVDVEAPDEPSERFVGQEGMFQKVAEETGLALEEVKRGKNIEAYFKALDEAEKNGETPEYKEWRKKNQELKEKAAGLLDEFYKEREVSGNLKLEIREIDDSSFRIHNGGEDYKGVKKEVFGEMTETQKEELSQRLGQYQGEMGQFSRFLKNKYLSSN
jgi:hypothetical protein